MQQRASPFSSSVARLTRLFAVFLCGVAVPSHAALLRACRPADTPLVCRLQSVLAFLEAAAVILAVLLLCAVLAAIRAYKRKSRKLSPDEITPDAP